MASVLWVRGWGKIASGALVSGYAVYSSRIRRTFLHFNAESR